jgi:hypothetical protein
MTYIYFFVIICFYNFIVINGHLRGPISVETFVINESKENNTNKNNCPNINSTIINEIEVHELFQYLTKISRNEIIERADKWKNVKLYNEINNNNNHTFDGYNMDTAGYISMVWKLPSPGFNIRKLSYFCRKNESNDIDNKNESKDIDNKNESNDIDNKNESNSNNNNKKNNIKKGDAFFNFNNNDTLLFNNWINPFSFNAYSQKIDKKIDLIPKNYSKLIDLGYFHCIYKNVV